MSADSNGPLTTFLLFVPLVAVPLLAVFGIPQFAPVVASPGADGFPELDSVVIEENPALQSSEGPFSPFSSDVARTTDSRDEVDTGGVGDAWNDPFDSSARPVQGRSGNAVAAGSDAPWAPPADALGEWEPDSVTDQLQPKQGRDVRPTQRHPDAFLPITDSRRQFDRGGPDPPTRFIKDESLRNGATPGGPSDPQSAIHSPQSAEPLTWRSAVGRLNELGIRHFQLEPGERNEFHFSCHFTPSDNPRITHRFEAEATEPLRAVEKVLAQVEQWLEKR